MRNRIYPIVVSLLLLLVVLSLQFSSYPLVKEAMQRLDFLVYDMRLRATLEPQAPDPRVVIVDIDEKSLSQEGHWPWPRNRLARLVENLSAQGVIVIAFDIVFPEAERNPAQMVLERLRSDGMTVAAVNTELSERLELFDNNAVFANTIAGRDVVLGLILNNDRAESKGELPNPVRFAGADGQRILLPEARSYIGNIGEFTRVNASGGFFSLMPDSDGIYRRTPMLQRFGDHVYPALSLEAVRLYMLLDEIGVRTAQIGSAEVVEAIYLGNREIPTDSMGRALVPFRGRSGSFPYVSAADVLNGTIPGGIQLAGTIALVGTTAQGLYDLRPTPVQGVYPGVEVHANIISGILDNRFPVEPDWVDGANFVISVVTGLLLAFVLPFLSPLWMLLFASSVASAGVGLNFTLWSTQGLILSLAPMLMLVALISLFNVAYGFLREFHGRRRLKGMFGQYVPPELVEEMNRNPGADYGFEGDSRDMSVLFCDIRSFTTISESLSAGRLKAMLNRFFTPMTQVIFEGRGTIDKYVGDMIMAFWGAPLEDPQHARHAIAAAMRMLEVTEALKPEFKAQGLPEVNVGIGINSGQMNVGDMGSEYRRSYTVLGDTVNLASRLEGTTKYYGVGLVVGEETRRQAGDAFLFRELDRVRVKGKAQAITVYEPVCPAEKVTKELAAEVEAHDEALALFRAREWEGARAAFEALHGAHPDTRLYALYLERIDALSRDDPGEGWDGVYERTTK